MRRSSFSLLCLLGRLARASLRLLALPALLVMASPSIAAPDADEEDDILAPVRGVGEKPSSAMPIKEKLHKVGVLPFVALGEVGKTTLDQATVEIMKALNESGTVDFKALALASSATATPIDAAATEQAKNEASASLAQALAMLNKLQYGKAKKQFEKTISLAEKAAGALTSPDLLITAWTGLAEIAARQAQDDEAQRAFRNVIALNPEFELDQKKYPGLFIMTHRKTRDAMLAGDKSSVLVDASAAGGTVEIDGRPIANAPAKAKGLYPGQHLVRVLREGLPSWGTIITVEAGKEAQVTPGFYDPKGKGPIDDLTQNRLSPQSAQTVGEAASFASYKGGLVGVVAKRQNKLIVQLVYVDAASKKVAVLPPINTQVDLLDVGIEALKARQRTEELAGAATPAVSEADEDDALIEGANAGSGVQLSEVTVRFDVRVSGNAPIATRAVDGAEDDDDDDIGERKVVESKTGSRRRFDDKTDRMRERRDVDTIDEDESITDQAWFWPTVIAGGVVGVAAIAGATTVGLIAAKVLPDPRPATGTQISVSFPSASP